MLTYYHEKHRLNSILALEKFLKKQHDSNMSMSNIYVCNCECKKPRKYYFCECECELINKIFHIKLLFIDQLFI